MTYDFVSDLESGVYALVQQILREEIAPLAEQLLNQHIIDDVYSYKSPWPSYLAYHRRGQLRSGAGIVTTINGLSMLTSDYTPGNTPLGTGATPTGTSLLEIVDRGLQGRHYWPGAFARPAVENAQKELDARIPQILRARLGSSKK